MELGRDEIELYCCDVLNSSLALIESALFTSKVELLAHNKEQFINLQITLDDIFNNFTYYYYAYGNNYTEHPCLGQYIDENEECETPSYLPEYYRNNAKSYYDSLIESGKCVINDNSLFKVEYCKQSNTAIQFLFSIKDKEKVKQALSDYISKYRYDEVYNEYENVFDYETQRKQLYELLTEGDYNLNNFHITDTKYIKSIIDCEEAGSLYIVNACISFNDNNELSCRFIISDNGFVFDYENERVVEDVEETKHDNKTAKQQTKKPRTHFSPSVQELYDYLKLYAPAKNYEIYKNDLIGEDRRNKLYTGMGTLTTMVNRLNKEYKEIYHTHKPLMKFDKFLDCYLIDNIWDN